MRASLIALVLALVPSSVLAQVQEWRLCRAEDADHLVIPACTRLIELDTLSQRDRAIAYVLRGKAHWRQRDFDDAIADENEALKIDPNLSLPMWPAARPMEPAARPMWPAAATMASRKMTTRPSPTPARPSRSIRTLLPPTTTVASPAATEPAIWTARSRTPRGRLKSTPTAPSPSFLAGTSIRENASRALPMPISTRLPRSSRSAASMATAFAAWRLCAKALPPCACRFQPVDRDRSEMRPCLCASRRNLLSQQRRTTCLCRRKQGDRHQPEIRRRSRNARIHLLDQGRPGARRRRLHRLGRGRTQERPRLSMAGKVVHRQGDFDRAIAAFSREIEIEPDNAEAYRYRSTAHGRKHDSGELSPTTTGRSK